MAEHADTAVPWEIPVGCRSVEAAWRIGQYLIPQARAAFAEMGADPAIEEARIVLRWLGRHVEATGATTVTRRDIHQGTKGRFKKAEAIDAPLALLVEYGYVRKLDTHAPRSRGQQPSPTYAINPLWASHNSHDSHE